MSKDREAIFARLRESLARLDHRTPYPDYAADVATPAARRGGGLALFRERLVAAGTRVVDDAASLGRLLREHDAVCGYCDPQLAQQLGKSLGPAIRLLTTFDRENVDDYQFGITRASAGIVETGSLVLTDRTTSDRLGALAPWIHVACLDPARLYPTLAEAIIGSGEDPNVILVTGHSQTADVEGILIHGVHGPGVQLCLFV